jgi:hypothetical protein
VNKNTLFAEAFITILLLSAMAGTQFVNLGRANPIPTSYTEMTIYPQNKTYNVNTITLNFYVETNTWLNFFYGLDGQKLEPIDNITIVSEELMNPGRNPTIYRTTLKGGCILSNLSEGWHNITVYQIGDYPTGKPQDGEIINSASTQFKIAIPPETAPFPTAPVAAASVATVAVVGVGLLVYFRKRKH